MIKFSYAPTGTSNMKIENESSLERESLVRLINGFSTLMVTSPHLNGFNKA